MNGLDPIRIIDQCSTGWIIRVEINHLYRIAVRVRVICQYSSIRNRKRRVKRCGEVVIHRNGGMIRIYSIYDNGSEIVIITSIFILNSPLRQVSSELERRTGKTSISNIRYIKFAIAITIIGICKTCKDVSETRVELLLFITPVVPRAAFGLCHANCALGATLFTTK